MAYQQPWTIPTQGGGVRSNIIPALKERTARALEPGTPAYLSDPYSEGLFSFGRSAPIVRPSQAAQQQVPVVPTVPQQQQQPSMVDRSPMDWTKAAADAQRSVKGFGRDRGALDRWTPEQTEANYQQGVKQRAAERDEIIRRQNATEADYRRGQNENRLLELTKQAGALSPPAWAVANPGAPGAREALAGYNAQMNQIQAQYDGLKQILGYGQENRKQSMEEQKTAGDVQYKGALGRQADITSRKAEAEIPFIGQEAQARIGTLGAQNKLYGAQADAKKVKARAAMVKALLEGQGGGSEGFGISGSDYVKQQLAAMKDLAQVNPELYNQYMQMLQSMPKRGAMPRPNQEGY